MPSNTHKWSELDNMFDRCSTCGLVQGVLAANHYTAKCPKKPLK